MKNHVPAFAAFIAIIFVSFGSRAESPNQEQKQKLSQPTWGRFQVLENPQIRLTFLIQSAYLESVEREIDQAPKLSRFLMEKMSLDASERKLAIEEYRQWWLAKEAEHIRQLEMVPADIQISSYDLRTVFDSEIKREAPSSLRRKRMLYVQMMLRSGFHDFTLAGFRAIESLEAEKDLGARFVRLAEILGQMTRDEDRLETLAALSNLLLLISSSDGVSDINRRKLMPHAVELSKKVDRAIRDSNLIDVLNPAGMVGGAVLFKSAGQLALKSPWIMRAFGYWSNSVSKTSTVAKATIVSAAGHAAVLSSVIQPKSKSTEGISPEAAARMQNGNLGTPEKVLRRSAGPANDSISHQAVRDLAQEILYSEAGFKSAWKYADLIAYGERLLASQDIYNLSVLGLKTSDFIERRDAVMLRFERYMAKRGLKAVDSDALAMLKALVDEHIPAHQDGQPYALHSTLRPAFKGNCVSRTLILTALFYPAYLRYENPDLKFGLMFWQNHVEAVLLNKKSRAALSIYSMTPLDLNESPSVLSPRALAGAFLYRSMSPRLFGQSLRYGVSNEKVLELYPRSRLTIASSKAKPVDGPADLTTSKVDRDPNPSPFISALYTDQLLVADRKSLLDDRLSTEPSSGGLRNIRDLMGALISAQSIDELSAKSNQTVGFRLQANGQPSADPDPYTTALSANETGKLVPSRSPTRLPIMFLRADEWSFSESSRNYLRRRKTPYESARDVEILLRRELKELQDNPRWKKLAAGDSISMNDFTSDIDFQFEIMDFSEIFGRLKRINETRTEIEMREFPFRYGVEDLIEILGVTDEYAEIRKAAATVVSPIVEDKSGRSLFEFLKAANELKNSDRVRQIQGLYVALKLSGKSEAFNEVLGRLELAVLNELPKADKVAPESDRNHLDLNRQQTKFDWSNSKPLIVQILPPKAGGGAGQETRLKVALEPQTAFLLIHYFNTAVLNWAQLIEQIAESEANSKTIQILSSKFFGWMPGIDVHRSWQSNLADGWADLSQKVCNPPQPTGTSGDCVMTKSVPPIRICKPVKLTNAKSKSCDLLSKMSGELMFDEISEQFDRPNL